MEKDSSVVDTEIRAWDYKGPKDKDEVAALRYEIFWTKTVDKVLPFFSILP